MTAKTATRTMPDTYFQLVKQFPLTQIRDDKQLAEAQSVIDRLLEQHLDKGEQAYLDVLTDLIEDFEEKHVPIPDASEADVLRELMRSHDLSQPKLAKAVGIAQSTISAILTGNRALTKAHLVKLARFFNISPAAFLPA
jgi:HTH-type transcriptional regulator / antitoxin HigA